MRHIWAIILLGCVSCSTTTHNIKPYYESLPPVPASGVHWKVLTKETIDDDVYIGVSYNDSLEHRRWLEQIKAYIERQNQIICQYQGCDYE